MGIYIQHIHACSIQKMRGVLKCLELSTNPHINHIKGSFIVLTTQAIREGEDYYIPFLIKPQLMHDQTTSFNQKQGGSQCLII